MARYIRQKLTPQQEKERQWIGDGLKEFVGLQYERFIGHPLNTITQAGEMIKGERPVDPVIAAEATLGIMPTTRGGGGVANLGLRQKYLLKLATRQLKKYNKKKTAAFSKSLRKNNLTRIHKRIFGKATRDITKGIQQLPDVAANNIHFLNIDPDMKSLGSFMYGRNMLKANPTRSNKNTIAHEATHALHGNIARTKNLQEGWVDGASLAHTPLEKRTNFKSFTIQNIARRINREITKKQKQELYFNLPQEHLARRTAQSYLQKLTGPHIDKNKLFLNEFNTHADTIIKALKKTSPKVYKKATKEANKQMKRVYGIDWGKGIAGFKKFPDS